MNIKGKLNPSNLSSIFKTFYENKETGSLVVSNSETKVNKSFYFKEGNLSWVSSSKKMSLEKALLKLKKIPEKNFGKMREFQSETNKPLEEVLVHSKIISENDLVEVIKQQLLEEVYEVYTWEKGVYEFRTEYLPDNFLKKLEKLHFSVNIDELIKEGSRWTRKAEKLKRNISKNKHLVFAIKEELRSQIDLLPDKEKRILLLIDGKRLIKEIVEKSGFLESEVYEILYSFAMNDIVLIEKNIYDNITFL